MNIKFEKNGIIKETHKKFTDDLIAAGWAVVKDKQPTKRSSKKDK